MTYAVFRIDIAISHRLPIINSPNQKEIKILFNNLIIKKDYGKRSKVSVIDDDYVKNIIVNDYQKDYDFNIGQVWQIKARLKSPISNLNQVGFNLENYSLANGIDAYASINKKNNKLIDVKLSLIDKIKLNLQKIRLLVLKRIEKISQKYNYIRGASLIEALALGITNYISENDINFIKKLGLIHLISISGLHVSMVFLCVMLFIRYFFILLSKSKIRYNLVFKTPIVFYSLIGFFVSFIYVLFSGFSVSAQRSILMLFVVVVAIYLRRYTHIWQMWWVSLTLVLIISPLSILNVGFWLSFLLVATLILSSYGYKYKKYPSKTILFFKAQWAISLASILLLGYFFHLFPIASPIVNIIAIPWFSLILTPLSLIAIIFPFDFLLLVAIFISEYTLKFLEFFDNIAVYFPLNKVPLVFFLLSIFAVIIAILPKGLGLKMWAYLIILCFMFFPNKKMHINELYINIFDVGQGESLLLQTKNHNLLFDTGNKYASNDLLTNLFYLGVKKLDILILSHNDNDHDGGLLSLKNNLLIKKFYVGQLNRYKENKFFKCKDQQWQWDGVSFRFFDVNAYIKTNKDNDASCVLKVTANNYSILITGDLSSKGEKLLLDKYSSLVKADILVLGHHGSKSSTSNEFLTIVNPKYAIIPVGINNVYYLPSKKTINRLKSKKIKIYRTDYDGQIKINFHSKNGILIKRAIKNKKFWQQKPFSLYE